MATNGVCELPTEAIIPAQPPAVLSIQRAPHIVLEEAAKAAAALRQVVESKPDKLVLGGKTYLKFEDWQTLGRFYGVTAAATSTNYIEYGRVRGFEAHARALLVSTDQVVSEAEAMCLDDEPKWSTRAKYSYQNGQRTQVGTEQVPLFQLRSMAQTRACAKALRNVLAWVVVLAGYAPTPAEEMDSVKNSSSPVNAAPVKRVPQDRCKEFCDRMEKAGNEAQLREVYFAAYREAHSNNDSESQEIYIHAKDARLRELRGVR